VVNWSKSNEIENSDYVHQDRKERASMRARSPFPVAELHANDGLNLAVSRASHLMKQPLACISHNSSIPHHRQRVD
jgi:hypothetical protein